jgi:hypothetical protein
MAAAGVESGDRYGSRRWWVHIGLLVSVIASVLVLMARLGVDLHIIAGLCFAALIGAHLSQRRRTLQALAGGLLEPSTWPTPRGRLAVSDGVLAFLALNVVVSGIADWLSPRPVMIGLPGTAALNWHTTASLLLIVYLVVHVVRRRRRLRHSRIR